MGVQSLLLPPALNYRALDTYKLPLSLPGACVCPLSSLCVSKRMQSLASVLPAALGTCRRRVFLKPGTREGLLFSSTPLSGHQPLGGKADSCFSSSSSATWDTKTSRHTQAHTQAGGSTCVYITPGKALTLPLMPPSFK